MLTSGVRIYTAPNNTDQTNIKVSAPFDTEQGAVKVHVATGVDLTVPVGATGSGSTATNNATITAYTSTVDGSRGICGAVEENALGTPSSTDQAEPWSVNLGLKGLSLLKATNTTPVGSTVTFNLDAAGSSPASWEWAALELLPSLSPSRPIRLMNVGQAVKRGTIW
ncbi:hypothetical protein Ssi03_50390 [Sphaerisporangium siamense]|nr:hypothetical protein Ssi03_50390 [Sphaerisporangium siamense]